MLVIATAWIMLLLLVGGFTLDRVVTNALTRGFDDQLEYLMKKMLLYANVGPDGEVMLENAFADQRFLEPYSGAYWQVTGKGYPPFTSQSLWLDLKLKADHRHSDMKPHFYDSDEFKDDHLRVIEQDVRLPRSPVLWRFQIAQSRAELDQQIAEFRQTLIWSFVALGVGLVAMAALQAWYGLRPLRKVRSEIARLRAGKAKHIEGAMPADVAPMVEELNALITHNDRQAEEARRHAGNLAHAIKTPLSVIMNAAAAGQDDLPDTVIREARTMRRQMDHHLARARAVGRRGTAHSRAPVWPSIEAVERAVARLYPAVRIDIDGDKEAMAHIEKQDLDEIVGNLVENAAKYGGGSVFVTVKRQAGFVEIMVEDDGRGIPEADRNRIFDRGVRLDTGKPGTGLGLAIVRDVAEIYDGTVGLEESEDLGGLMVRLRLPAAN
ncbi:HAMP domain-containing sensor histidine kinase [Sphingomonas sp.]|uniref:sensor histidine kinase n=1 Tax=Sphingomonas sp. TaxID=28214 RepID=UPI001B1ED3BD|nr:HAMP domain-containing sensor histidine kinase [Sphingomonas sp.]MBO9714433.1 HAMP domain-containing histidine kinase [Sphingomonas sp.]